MAIDATNEEVSQTFASIEAISGDHAGSSNPWVEAHKSLDLIQDSSKKLIKAEEKRQKDLRDSWKGEMDAKADIFPQKAADQKWWGNCSGVLMMATMTAPFLATVGSDHLEKMFKGIGNASTLNNANRNITELANKVTGQTSPLNNAVNPDLFKTLLHKIDTKTIQSSLNSQWSQTGNQLIQGLSQHASIKYQEDETFSEWASTKEKQDLDQQGQQVQEARQADTSLKERHLEIIKTLTAQVTGR